MAYSEFEINVNDLKTKEVQEKPFLISALIQANIEDEASATRKYFQLLDYLTDEADKEIIKEIISDELNHAQKLKDLVLKHSKIRAAID